MRINIREMVTIFWLLLHFFHAFFIVDRARCKLTTGRSAVEVNIENERFNVVCSRFYLKFGNFTLWFGRLYEIFSFDRHDRYDDMETRLYCHSIAISLSIPNKIEWSFWTCESFTCIQTPSFLKETSSPAHFVAPSIWKSSSQRGPIEIAKRPDIFFPDSWHQAYQLHAAGCKKIYNFLVAPAVTTAQGCTNYVLLTVKKKKKRKHSTM